MVHISRVPFTLLTYGLDDRGVGVRVPVGKKYSLLHIVHTGF
jgi:glutamine synthetase